MMIGTLVRCPISKIVGVIAPAPEDVPPYALKGVWVLVTYSKDVQFVGTVHPWDEARLEVLNEMS